LFGDSFSEAKLAVTSVLRSGDVGVTNNGGLLDTINSKAPIYAQLIQEGVNRYIAMRKSLATKIISAFVVINTFVGAMPAIDIVLAPIVDYTMLNILQHLRTMKSRTAQKYRDKYLIKLAVGCAIRGALLVAGLVAEMSLVFALIGATSGAVITGGTTLALGYHAYEYFTSEEVDEDDLSDIQLEFVPAPEKDSDNESDNLTDVSDSESEEIPTHPLHEQEPLHPNQENK